MPKVSKMQILFISRFSLKVLKTLFHIDSEGDAPVHVHICVCNERLYWKLFLGENLRQNPSLHEASAQ